MRIIDSPLCKIDSSGTLADSFGHNLAATMDAIEVEINDLKLNRLVMYLSETRVRQLRSASKAASQVALAAFLRSDLDPNLYDAFVGKHQDAVFRKSRSLTPGSPVTSVNKEDVYIVDFEECYPDAGNLARITGLAVQNTPYARHLPDEVDLNSFGYNRFLHSSSVIDHTLRQL